MNLKGAEAIVLIEKDKVRKIRVEKSYRNKDYDILIRKKRTKREAKILQKLREKVKVPKILEIKDFEIVMEKIEGKLLKNSELSDEQWKKLGKEISKIHNLGIIHGDLTTKNIIIKDKDFYFIDFGLAFFSKKIEDKATDLIVLKEILELENRGEKFNLIMEGYESNDKKEILKKINEIEERGRYKKKLFVHKD
ncbi:MAG TPA: Kae1-associated serine/threonine protein kinase [Nautiliaceae bacterium]|nr:Kae1-associated serine/threonine protein kinase [Nautiliaceae bacterium]